MSVKLKQGERLKGIGLISIAIGTLALILNDIVFHGPSAATVTFAVIDFIGLVCLITGGIITKNKVNA